jgi:hypothetical protein
MAKYQYSMLICCRGLGKSWLSAVFFVCAAILYPGIKLGIASGKGQQARNVIIQKIKGELAKNENIAREILFPIKTGSEDCVVNFKNGSEIRAIVLGQNQSSGDGARSWRFHFLLIDEARVVKDEVTEKILIPMTKTKRPIAIEHSQPEKGKVIFISSAFLKTSDLYKRFMYFFNKMQEGNKNYYVCALDYKVGIEAGIFDEEDIQEERNKPDTTEEIFNVIKSTEKQDLQSTEPTKEPTTAENKLTEETPKGPVKNNLAWLDSAADKARKRLDDRHKKSVTLYYIR